MKASAELRMRKIDTIVVTSINPPNAALRAIAAGAEAAGIGFIVIGDTKSPADFALPGCRFLHIEAQIETGFGFARQCPTRHYARKNIGYLLAIRDGAHVIRETDDDNLPRPAFFASSQERRHVPVLRESGWTNVYGYFTEARIWPRGLPLDAVADPIPALPAPASVHCPIQQGLADDNPDVDAVYRLLFPLPQRFRDDRDVALGRDAWCPFNSQNTTWWKPAFPLLYLPAYCSFRMTDIWRSFVAQRIAWANDWHILFHGPTVWQERNTHDLMADFRDEVTGYLNNRAIAEALGGLDLPCGEQNIGENLRRCYRRLVEIEVIGAPELPLLDCWLADLESLGF